MKALTQAQVDSIRHDGFLFPVPRSRKTKSPPASPACTGWSLTSAALSPRRT